MRVDEMEVRQVQEKRGRTSPTSVPPWQLQTKLCMASSLSRPVLIAEGLDFVFLGECFLDVMGLG